jgi:hypothetical protein
MCQPPSPNEQSLAALRASGAEGSAGLALFDVAESLLNWAA